MFTEIIIRNALENNMRRVVGYNSLVQDGARGCTSMRKDKDTEYDLIRN
jgi:hypothetical protein